MHVGLNLIFLVPGETGGMETVARSVIPELLAAGGDTRFTAFVNREAAGEDLGVPKVVVPVRATRRVAWVAGEQALLPRLAHRAGVDVLHSMGNTAPLRGRHARLVTVHDLASMIVPDAHGAAVARVAATLVRQAARRAHRVVTVSRASASDITRLLGVPADHIDVVPNGLGRPPAPGIATPEAELRARLGLGGRPVLLCLSAKRPHKNLPRLLDALARIPVDRRPLTVLPGYPTPHEQELRERAEALGIAGDLRLVGWIADADVEGLFALARAFVFPSLYEGFGLPVLEAMARGVAVATSDRPATAEVAGDAALLFDPEDPAAIAGAIERLLGDEELRERLAAAGPPRAAQFTWRRTAEGLLASYERTLAAAR